MAKKEPVEIEFSFYLDAWLYCIRNNIDFFNKIKKKNFKTWIVAV